MNDSYRIDPNGRPAAPQPRRRRGWVVRALLWIVLVVSTAVNVVTNTIGGGSTPHGLTSGLIAVGCIAGLIAHHLAGRRRS